MFQFFALPPSRTPGAAEEPATPAHPARKDHQMVGDSARISEVKQMAHGLFCSTVRRVAGQDWAGAIFTRMGKAARVDARQATRAVLG
jgi:hypothetical protein